MTFVEFKVTPDLKVIDELIEDIQSAPARFNARADKLFTGRGGYVTRVRREVTPYPPKPKYPLRWKSERQRKAYFASRGFGRGIPSRRTGQLGRSWRILYRPLSRGGDGSVQIVNEDPKARFVIGRDQQPFHLDTGWIRPDKSTGLAKIERDMGGDLSELWLTILMPRRRGR